jgi:hypothetical protein
MATYHMLSVVQRANVNACVTIAQIMKKLKKNLEHMNRQQTNSTVASNKATMTHMHETEPTI